MYNRKIIKYIQTYFYKYKNKTIVRDLIMYIAFLFTIFIPAYIRFLTFLQCCK